MPWRSDSFSCWVISFRAIWARWAAGREASLHGHFCAAAVPSKGRAASRIAARSLSKGLLACQSLAHGAGARVGTMALGMWPRGPEDCQTG